MKKLILFILATCFTISTAIANTSFTWYKTLDKAQQYCATVDTIIFYPNNPAVQNSAGYLAGTNGATDFTSTASEPSGSFGWFSSDTALLQSKRRSLWLQQQRSYNLFL